jgi:hypothetical protein
MCGKVKACCAITNHLQDPICSSRKNATEIAGIAQDINTEVCKKIHNDKISVSFYI